ncbi:uncharacterized protein LOC112504562 [Cynara cardunculus var. scolymus]|uniref:uncharacterized protein LOC112504562 n=1 Tax=Cynara cardunculus var. scolymus TaxID=59895 RepID=UPI000D6236E0|nr:uncharacterized protein LOC112504562 [Cynara cardunculus var. scolymus]
MGSVDDNHPSDPNRVSVFEHLSSVEQNLDGNRSNGLGSGGRTNLNFAKAVGRSVATDLNFYPLADKKQVSVTIPIEMAKEAAKAYYSVLYGYFLGPRIPFPLVKNFVKMAWGKFGFLDAMLNENGIFFSFKFNDVGGCDQVIEAGPLMIRGVSLFVHRWDPSKGLKKPEHSSCPLWVKLHNIPLVAFNKEGVSRIASLGVPKQMDSCTATMCEKAWGRPGFAKVLVEVWAVGELKRKIEVEIPNINGGDAENVQIQVEYLWEPVQCSHCQIFGHKLSSCAKAASLNKGKQIDGRKDADGFTRVEKKQWRVKVGGRSNQSNARQDNGRKETGPHEMSLEEHSVSKDLEKEGNTVTTNVASVDPHIKEVRNALGDSSTNVNSGASSSQSTIHSMSTSTPLLSSVIKNFRLPRRGVMINPVEASNRFGVLEKLGEEIPRVDSHEDVVNGVQNLDRDIRDNRVQGEIPTSSSC